MSRALVLGLGYVGQPLARRLGTAGWDVTGWVRTPESAAALPPLGLRGIVTGSVGDPACWQKLSRLDLIVHAASSSRGGAAAYEEVFARGIGEAASRHPFARLVMISSTSVYAQREGELVDETSPAEPATETGRILRAAEQVAIAHGGIVLRSAGIYGPGRLVLVEKLRRGDAVIEGDGGRWLNQVYRDDLVEALLRGVDTGEPGEIYNASDDEPVRQRDYYAWCAGRLGLPLPPQGPVDINRKRGLSSKRISNAKLRALGWVPRHPTFREGVDAAMSAPF